MRLGECTNVGDGLCESVFVAGVGHGVAPSSSCWPQQPSPPATPKVYQIVPTRRHDGRVFGRGVSDGGQQRDWRPLNPVRPSTIPFGMDAACRLTSGGNRRPLDKGRVYCSPTGAGLG